MDKLRCLGELLADRGLPGAVVEAVDPAMQRGVWELRKAGLAANVTIMTESAGPIAILALVLQWLQTSLDAVL